MNETALVEASQELAAAIIDKHNAEKRYYAAVTVLINLAREADPDSVPEIA